MVWGATEETYTIHAIGKVECGMDYGATNPTDVISVGLFQWRAQRAATILNLIKSGNPTAWTSVPSSLDNDLTSHSETDSFWSNRYLTLKERQGLHSALSDPGSTGIQDSYATADVDDYVAAGTAAGIDKDTNSETMAFFCNIYNRNPASARRIIGNCGPDSSLARIYSFTINDATEGQYKTRYSQARDIIAAHDTSEVGSGVAGIIPGSGNGGGTGTNGDNGGTQNTGKASYLTQRGHQILLVNKDGTKQVFALARPDYWIASIDQNAGTPPVTDPPSGGTPPPGAIADLIAWELAHLNAFAYSQGAGRLNPVSSGYTDCSGLHYYAYLKFANKDIGTWTGTQISHGQLITTDPTHAKDESNLVAGDLVFYRWGADSPNTYDHVALYEGSNHVISHGGPDPGPDVESHSGNIDTAIGAGGSIMVRRYL